MSIQTEAEFKKAKESFLQGDSGFVSERFHELERFVKEALGRQDSDTALRLITK